MEAPTILFDYGISPYGHKVRLVLAAKGIPFKQCEQPMMLPRPILQGLGITYRRIPVLAIGKDVYCGTVAIISRLQEMARAKALSETRADMAYDAFSDRVFWGSWPLIPAAAITPEFAKDRKSIAPVFSRPDFESLRPSSLAEFKGFLNIVEHTFLEPGQDWIGGQSISIGDIHVGAVIKWVLETVKVGQEFGFDEIAYPRIYQWLQKFPNPKFEAISGDEATKSIMQSEYTARKVNVDPSDVLGFAVGTSVSIELSDAAPGSDPQTGRLVGLSSAETVIELENGLRLHFPRLGCFVRKIDQSRDCPACIQPSSPDGSDEKMVVFDH